MYAFVYIHPCIRRLSGFIILACIFIAILLFTLIPLLLHVIIPTIFITTSLPTHSIPQSIRVNQPAQHRFTPGSANNCYPANESPPCITTKRPTGKNDFALPLYLFVIFFLMEKRLVKNRNTLSEKPTLTNPN